MENHESIQERRNSKEYACNVAKHLPQLQIPAGFQSKIDVVNRKIKDCWNIDAATFWETLDMKPEEHSEGDLSP